MSIKTVLVVCAQALLIQSISAMYIGGYGGLGYDGCGCGGIGYGGFGYDGFGYGGLGYGGFGYDGFGYGGLGYDGFGYGGLGYGGFGYGGLGYGGCGYDGFGPAGLSASNGPGLAVSSVSPMIPVGVSVLSENVYEGTLAAGGAVPFLGTVAIEGALPTAGAGAISYGCGNGAVAITAEDGYAGFGAGYGGLAGPFGYGYGLAGPFGYGAGYGGCGCGAFY